MKKFKKLWALIAVAIIACGFCVPTRAMGVQDKMKVRFAISEQALKFLVERCDIVNGHLIKHGEDYSQINEWDQMSR